MSKLEALYHNIRMLPSNIVGTLTCFCLNHQSTLVALAQLPLSSNAFSTTLVRTGVPKHILARWLMRNVAGASIIASVISDCRYPWQLTDMVDVLCAPSDRKDKKAPMGQDAAPEQVPAGFLINKGLMDSGCPSLLLLYALCQLPTFNAKEFCQTTEIKELVITVLERWQAHGSTTLVLTIAYKLGAYIPYDPRILANVVYRTIKAEFQVQCLLRLFHSCPYRSQDLNGVGTAEAQLLWRKNQRTIAITLGLFAPYALDSMIPQGKRFVDELRRLKISQSTPLELLIDEHLLWCAIQVSEQSPSYIEEQKRLAADTEQENIRRAYAASASRFLPASVCKFCASELGPDKKSFLGDCGRPEYSCCRCFEARRDCHVCATFTTGATCSQTTSPDKVIAVPMCPPCRSDRDSPLTSYQHQMAWPSPLPERCYVKCSVCEKEIQLCVDEFCSDRSPLSSTARFDIRLDPFACVCHVECLAKCESCPARLDLNSTTIIGGIPHCRACWVICPGCREPLQRSIFNNAPINRNAPSERCYHTKTPSPMADDDGDDKYEDDDSPYMVDDLDVFT